MLFFPSLFVKVIFGSFILWIVLSTCLPQLLVKYTNSEVRTNRFTSDSYPSTSITFPHQLPIHNSTLYFVIGHPDDEVMFFSPSIIELGKPKYNNDIHLVCFSNGDAVDPSMGSIRSNELLHSATILGVPRNKVTILSNYKDGMNITWDHAKINNSLKQIIGTSAKDLVLITFDESGVSKHPNHISLYHGCKQFYKSFYSKNKSVSLYVLKSLNFWEKYSFTLLTNVELFVDYLSKYFISNILKININISFFQTTANSSVKIYSDLNMLSVSYAAMGYGHFSQMVWFRYAWLVLSRYLTFNHLIQIE